MLWHKAKYQLKLHGGRGTIKTDALHGNIEHLVIKPKNQDTVWSVLILDSEEDEVFSALDIEGKLDDRYGIPVGLSKPEPLRIELYDATSNEEFSIVLKVKETR